MKWSEGSRLPIAAATTIMGIGANGALHLEDGG